MCSRVAIPYYVRNRSSEMEEGIMIAFAVVFVGLGFLMGFMFSIPVNIGLSLLALGVGIWFNKRAWSTELWGFYAVPTIAALALMLSAQWFTVFAMNNMTFTLFNFIFRG